MCRFDLVFLYERRESASIQSDNGGHDRGRQREWRDEPFNAFFENNLP